MGIRKNQVVNDMVMLLNGLPDHGWNVPNATLLSHMGFQYATALMYRSPGDWGIENRFVLPGRVGVVRRWRLWLMKIQEEKT